MKTLLRSLAWIVLVSTAAAICSSPTEAKESQPSTFDLDIQGQPLSDALVAFAQRSGLQVAFDPPITEGFIAPPLKGKYTVEGALHRLLMNSSLVFDFVNSNTIKIRERDPALSSARSSLRSEHRDDGRDDVIRLARVEAEASPDLLRRESDREAKEKKTSRQSTKESSESPDEIVVTGTNIRGIAPVGSPLIVMDEEYIQRSGYTTTEQLMQSLPQNFKGGESGASSDGYSFGSGSLSGVNFTGGAGVNLRGLGTSATLVLINSRRMAASSYGYFTDVSAIPITAIERVEILSDGASAVYGADAVGGVVNFILKKHYRSNETQLGYGFTSDGGRTERRVGQSLGAGWESGSLLLIGNYLEQDALMVEDRQATINVRRPTTAMFPNQQKNILLSIQHKFNDGVAVQADVQYADFKRESIRTSSVATTFLSNEGEHYDLGTTISYALDDKWQLSLDASASHENDLLHPGLSRRSSGDIYLAASEFKLNTRTVGLKMDGALVRLPGGILKIGTGVSRLKEDFSRDRPASDLPPLPFANLWKSDRTVDSAFAEVYIPLVNPESNWKAVHALQLSLATRYDKYSDFGDTINPKIGVAWDLSPELKLHASYGTSFRAPKIGYETSATSLPGSVGVANFPGPDGISREAVVLLLGSARSLVPEESDNWTLGLSYKPKLLSDLTLKATYYAIDYVNQIVAPPYDSSVLSNISLSPFVSQASSDELKALVAAREALGASFSDTTRGAFGPNPLDVATYLYDIRLTNAALSHLNGIDISIIYTPEIGNDRFSYGLNASYIHRLDTQFTIAAPTLELVNTYANPVDWRIRSDFSWERGSLGAAFSVNYTSNYTNTSVLPSEPIRSYITVDMNTFYKFDRHGGPLQGVKVSLGATNLFNQRPPFINSGVSNSNYDSANANLLGRSITVMMTKSW